jgi:adhesin transport system membrane fusion protein
MINIKNFKRKDNSTLKRKELTHEDYEYIDSLSGAILEKHPKKLHVVLLFWVVTIFAFILWASLSQIDEIARGVGDVIPSNENQVVQNLEGGIVEEILAREGTVVKKGDILLKINNEKSVSTFESNEVKSLALEAKILRLQAQSQNKEFDLSSIQNEMLKPYIQNELSLYQTNKKQLNSSLEVLQEQLKQKINAKADAKSKKHYLSKSLAMIRKEIDMTEPMVERGIASQVDLLRLQKEENNALDESKSASFAIDRLNSEIQEIQHKIEETKLSFAAKAKEQLNESIAEYKKTLTNAKALEDQVTRTIVKAPRDGIVQELFVHTIGGVVKPGDDLVEIVPSNEKLLVNAKIKPSDIAFIYPGQKAIVKFTAYDFSIFGGMDAKVVSISPDTVKDKDENTYYIVRIETLDNELKSEKEIKIIPGMTAQVDILTGKKSILSYILKPILKTKQYAFGEQ